MVEKGEDKAKVVKVKDTAKTKTQKAQVKPKKTSVSTKAKTSKPTTITKQKQQKRPKQKISAKMTKKKTVIKEERVSVPQRKVSKFNPGTIKVNLYSISGKSSGEVVLPEAFDEEFRLDLIRKAVNAAQANRRQPYGPTPEAGMSHSTSTWGKGRGVARVQRLVSGRRAVESPNNVGGRRAHPPTVERVWSEKINKKERNKARRAALAAIAKNELVAKRGHKFDKNLTLPLILEDEFEKIERTQKALEIFQSIGIHDDILRAVKGKHIRAGKGKGRGRLYKRPKSILIITSGESEIRKSVKNLIGVDVITPDSLSIEDLAPGGDPGRLTIITESALKQMGSW